MDLSFHAAWTVGSALFAIGGAWFLVKRCVDDIKEMWKVLTKVRDWQGNHDKESGEKRVDFERRIGELATETARNQAQYESMNRRLDSIDAKLDRLIENRNG